VNGHVAEIELALEIVQRPVGLRDPALVARVGADRRVAVVHRRARLVLNLSDEPAAPAHHELAVPLVGQQQREVNLAADDPVDAAVRDADRAARRRRHGRRLGDLYVRQFEHHQVRALGMIGRALRGNSRSGGDERRK
jgi:hypothetical protein